MTQETKEMLPEAPASANIKFWVDGFGIMLTMRGTEVSDVLGKVIKVVGHAQEQNWQPSWKEGPTGPSETPEWLKETVPMCKVHNREMRRFDGKFGPFYKCTKKLGEGEYCNEKANIS